MADDSVGEEKQPKPADVSHMEMEVEVWNVLGSQTPKSFDVNISSNSGGFPSVLRNARHAPRQAARQSIYAKVAGLRWSKSCVTDQSLLGRPTDRSLGPSLARLLGRSVAWSLGEVRRLR